jgi:uncharacterized protein (TIRG00374 family)
MKRLRVLFLSIGLLLYALLLWKLDIWHSWVLLCHVNLPLLALAILAGLPEIFFKSLRFRLLGKPETHLSISQSFHIYLSGQPMALVTPGKLGDVTRVWLFKRFSKRPMPECLAVHTADKIFDFSALAILATIGILGWIGNHGNHSSGVLAATGGVLAGLSLTLALLNPEWFKPLVKFLIRQWVPPEKADPLKHHGREFLEKLKHRLSPSTKNFFLAFAYSLLAWEFAILRAWICSVALGIPLSFGLYMLGAPLVVMVELLPISILGFGTRETALILLFASASLTPEALVAFGLLATLAGPVTTALLGLPASMEILREQQGTKT